MKPIHRKRLQTVPAGKRHSRVRTGDLARAIPPSDGKGYDFADHREIMMPLFRMALFPELQ